MLSICLAFLFISDVHSLESYLLWFDGLDSLRNWNPNNASYVTSNSACPNPPCVRLNHHNDETIIRETVNAFESYTIQLDVGLWNVVESDRCRLSVRFGDDGDFYEIDDDRFRIDGDYSYQLDDDIWFFTEQCIYFESDNVYTDTLYIKLWTDANGANNENSCFFDNIYLWGHYPLPFKTDTADTLQKYTDTNVCLITNPYETKLCFYPNWSYDLLWYDALDTLNNWEITDAYALEEGSSCTKPPCVLLADNEYMIRGNKVQNSYESYTLILDVGSYNFEPNDRCRVSVRFSDDGDFYNIDDDRFNDDVSVFIYQCIEFEQDVSVDTLYIKLWTDGYSSGNNAQCLFDNVQLWGRNSFTRYTVDEDDYRGGGIMNIVVILVSVSAAIVCIIAIHVCCQYRVRNKPVHAKFENVDEESDVEQNEAENEPETDDETTQCTN